MVFFSWDASYRHIMSRHKGCSHFISISFFHMEGEDPKHNRTEKSIKKQPTLRWGNQVSCPVTTKKKLSAFACVTVTKGNLLLLDSHSWSSVVCVSAAKLTPRAGGHRSHSVLLDKESSQFEKQSIPPYQTPAGKTERGSTSTTSKLLQPHAFLLLFSAASRSCSAVLDHPHLHPPSPPPRSLYFTAAMGSSPSLLVAIKFPRHWLIWFHAPATAQIPHW